MEDQEPIRIGRFDQVRLVTTKNVKYLSAPSPKTPDPNGIWSVCAVIDDELLVVKNNITIRIPASDVLKIADYNIQKFTANLGRLSRGEGNQGKSSETKRFG